jgi:amino acid adenylation domain-containing protein
VDHLSVASLPQYLEETAARTPDGLAVMDADGAALSYRMLFNQASRIAGFLLKQGVQRGDRIAVVLPKNLEAVSAIFGIMQAGAAYVPIDWTGPVERIRSILSDCAVRLAFLDSRRTDFCDVVPCVSWNEAAASDPISSSAGRPQPGDLAYVLYTSGSTGVPKGVMLTHRNAISYVDWCSTAFHPVQQDRFSSHAPFHFDLSILDLYVPLKHGASVHLIPDDLGKSPKALAQFIAERRITVWYSTPAILSLLAQFGNLTSHDHSSLRAVLFAGEVFPVKQLRLLTSLWPNPEYYNLYGPTETNVCTFARIPLPVPADRNEPYPIGVPCSHCAALVVSADDETSAGEGLLYISGPSVFAGYWGRPQETTASFLERNGGRWYNTGDVVRDSGSDGFLYLGRRDRMIKRRGYRIELGEIESCLYRHPAVKESAAIAVVAESGVQIVAYLSVAKENTPSIIELKRFCGEHLPSYMNPDRFVLVDFFPRTSTNKTDYQTLTRGFATLTPSAHVATAL